MKRFFLVISSVLLLLFGGIMFAACNDPSNSTPPPIPPVAPTLEKTSFYIEYDINTCGTYKLKWTAQNASKYKVKCGETETVVNSSEFSLNDFAADTVHTIQVTAVGAQELESSPVEVKFKGTKMDAPTNVRVNIDDYQKYYFGFKNDDAAACKISCEEMDIGNDGYIWTGNFKSTVYFENKLYIDGLTEIFKTLDLSAMQSFRVAALPYAENQEFDYQNDTDVMEISLPSDLSEQKVCFFASVENPHPTNLRWDIEELEQDAAYGTIRFDAGVDFKHRVTVSPYPFDVSFSSRVIDKRVSSCQIDLGYYTTGDYKVTVESVLDEFNYVTESPEEKWAAFSITLTQPVTEELKFHINHTQLPKPQNVRIEGDAIVWDYPDADYRNGYIFDAVSGNTHIQLTTEGAKSVSFSDIFENFSDNLIRINSFAGDYDVKIQTSHSKNNKYVGMANGMPVINTYSISDYSNAEVKLFRVKSIPSVSNIQLDFDTNTVTWNGIPEAKEYQVSYKQADGGSTSSSVGAAERDVSFYDLSQYVEVVVIAIGEYKLATENGIATLYIPSAYSVSI